MIRIRQVLIRHSCSCDQVPETADGRSGAGGSSTEGGEATTAEATARTQVAKAQAEAAEARERAESERHARERAEEEKADAEAAAQRAQMEAISARVAKAETEASRALAELRPRQLTELNVSALTALIERVDGQLEAGDFRCCLGDGEEEVREALAVARTHLSAAPARDRRDLQWMRTLQSAVAAEPTPVTLAAALVPLAAVFPVSDVLSQVEEVRAQWRNGEAWGHVDDATGERVGYVLPVDPATGRRPPLLPGLGLTAANGFGAAVTAAGVSAASAAAAAEENAEELALAIFAYTLEEPALYEALNQSLQTTGGSHTRASHAGSGGYSSISAHLRRFVPYLKLLAVALRSLPTGPPEDPFVITDGRRCFRGVKHVFPGYPGYRNALAPGSAASPQVHDPERHFQLRSVVCWYGVSSTSEVLRVQNDFVGTTGPATMFQIDVHLGYRITKLSYFGQRESEVLLPLLAQLEVLGVQKLCVPAVELAAGAPYPPDYVRVVGGPDTVQLRQLVDARASADSGDAVALH